MEKLWSFPPYHNEQKRGGGGVNLHPVWKRNSINTKIGTRINHHNPFKKMLETVPAFCNFLMLPANSKIFGRMFVETRPEAKSRETEF